VITQGRILLLDDSDVNLTVYRAALKSLPEVDVVSATNPKVALALLAQEHFDVAVVDYHMPEMDGLSFIREASHNGSSGILSVMLTGETDVEIRRAALDAGVADFLIKPIDRSEFAARMRNLVALALSRRKLSDRAAQLKDEVDRATVALREQEVETITRLTRAAEFRDSITGFHVIRVGEICAALGRTMGLTTDECRHLMLAAPMHDIGKVATPDHILLKPGRLTPEEFEVMKLHTIAGYTILKDSTSPMLQMAAEIALNHHEKWDGSGYPNGLRRTEIPISARLCSIADVFDALTSVRPYKVAWTIDDAVAEINKLSGTQFDPDIVAIFHTSLQQIIEIKHRLRDETSAA
jgi:putative two-component system response regulator